MYHYRILIGPFVCMNYCPFWIFHQKVCTCNTSKICMLAYYHMEIHISLQHFDWTIIYKEVIALFDLKYCMKTFIAYYMVEAYVIVFFLI
jgi:hypothetical protein